MSDEKPSATPGQPPPAAPRKPPPEPAGDPNRALWALLFFLVFAGLCWLVVSELRNRNRLEECAMAGGKNCDSELPRTWDR